MEAWHTIATALAQRSSAKELLPCTWTDRISRLLQPFCKLLIAKEKERIILKAGIPQREKRQEAGATVCPSQELSYPTGFPPRGVLQGARLLLPTCAGSQSQQLWGAWPGNRRAWTHFAGESGQRASEESGSLTYPAILPTEISFFSTEAHVLLASHPLCA